MMNVGDIVIIHSEKRDYYYVGVIMEICNDTVFVQDFTTEQSEVAITNIEKATTEDMVEELRSICGYYN